ncbi:hypothetical protein GGI00_005631 [Coemansia sp. RSA 2681]|nr:hypothetical protein GGI00_005631 [Coemansia sp. RSA 2681]
MALAAILALVAHSAPCPHIDKRQLDMLGELAADIAPEAVVADGTQLYPPLAADTLDTAAALTSDTTNNLAGNTLTQIDDSANNSTTNIEYPDDTQMTGNTGTAVSGNNNDIMPIINAPVTVIINNSENSHRHHAGGKPLPAAEGAPHPPMPPNAGPMWQQQQQQQPSPPQAWAAPIQPGGAASGAPLVQQPVDLPYPAQANADPFTDRIQQLIAYALAVSQGHI